MSRRVLCGLTGVPDRLLGKIERNADPRTGFALKTAVALADALGVANDELLLDGTRKREGNADPEDARPR